MCSCGNLSIYFRPLSLGRAEACARAAARCLPRVVWRQGAAHPAPDGLLWLQGVVNCACCAKSAACGGPCCVGGREWKETETWIKFKARLASPLLCLRDLYRLSSPSLSTSRLPCFALPSASISSPFFMVFGFGSIAHPAWESPRLRLLPVAAATIRANRTAFATQPAVPAASLTRVGLCRSLS